MSMLVDPRPAPPPTPTTSLPPAGIPFSRLFRVELRKLVDTTSGRWLLIAIAGITALVLAVMWFTAPSENLTFRNFLQASATPQGLLLPVLGILAATAEWSKRTGLVTFTLEPRRLRIVLAKLLAALALGVVSIAIAVGLAALAVVASAAIKDTGSWEISWPIVGGVVLGMLLAVAQGVAFGLIIPVTAAAIVGYFLIPQAWLLLGLWERVRDLAGWLDLNQTMTPLLEGEMTPDSWARLATSAGFWVVLPLVVGAALLMRREVK